MVLTLVNDLAKQVLPPEEIPSGAVPPPIPELVLTLVYGQISAFDDRHNDTGVIPDQLPLLTPEG